MLDLISFSEALRSLDLSAKLPTLFHIFQSFLCLSHTAGVRPLSRYSGVSERTLFRIIATEISWLSINISLFKHFICPLSVSQPHGLIGDEVVEKKAGKETFGMRKFFSTTSQKAVNGVDFFGFSTVNLSTGETAPLDLQQVIYTEADEARLQAEKEAKKVKKVKKTTATAEDPQENKKRGRGKGVKNKPKEDPTKTKPVYRAFEEALKSIFYQIAVLQLPVAFSHILLDSAYTAAHYIDLLAQYKLFIISKFPTNVALYFPYQGEASPTKPRKYGNKVQFNTLDTTTKHIKTFIEDGIKYDFFQYQAWRKSCPKHLFNVLTIRATHKNGKITHAHLCSNDLTLTALQIKQYYELRFQIEFNFRDIKQLLGLTKLKNYHKTQLNNMFRWTFSALLFAKILQKQWAQKLQIPTLSLIDLKTIYKAQFYLKQAINNTQKQDISFFSTQFVDNFVPTDLINRS